MPPLMPRGAFTGTGWLPRRLPLPHRGACCRQLCAAADEQTKVKGPPRRVTTQLKDMLDGKDLSFLMEAHNGLSAKIVEETGFKGIWASGLSVSAALGVRDSNEASWTQVLEQIEFMSDCVNIPILLDGDTGYGNFNNARRLISKLESRGVAGVCLEDKLFPKTNSFIDGELQPLADINEFCGKIMACKDTQVDPDFCVVARLEAFITGYGLDEALKRADAYHRAGADAILCHSKKANDSDIADFMSAWGDRCPVVIVPTKYWEVPTKTFEDYGVSTVIWANHNMRSAIQSMQETTKQIYDNQSLASVEGGGRVVPVSEVFRLQNTAELKTAEKRYEDVATVLRALDETESSCVKPESFFRAMQERGTSFFTGVPDSLLKNFCDFVTDNTDASEHVISANEGTAVGLAAGHHLATGEVPVVYLQNSGLGNIVNPILSLADPKVYSIPMLLVIGWRGEPGKKDEPQHQVQGRVTPHLLREMSIPYEVLPDFDEGMESAVANAYSYMNMHRGPYALLIKKNTFAKYKMPPQVVVQHDCTREEVLNIACEHFGETPTVTTTGFTSREMFELREARGEGQGRDFLTVGSMGHCSSIALGMALSRDESDPADGKVLCIDGDGGCIMHMGAMVTVGQSGASNFKHLLINNGMHDSVGGQPSKGFNVDAVKLAEACGYHEAKTASTREEIEAGMAWLATTEGGPSFLEVRVKGGSRPNLGRPTTTPIQNKQAYMRNNGVVEE